MSFRSCTNNQYNSNLGNGGCASDRSLRARGFTAEDFALSHPGALGRKLLLHVSDLMNKEEDIPRVTKDATLREALVEITRKN